MSQKSAEPKGIGSIIRKKSSRSSWDNRARSLVPSGIPTSKPLSRKRALLCCISYKNYKYELKGTSTDLENMLKLLEKFDFPRDSIQVLAEKEQYGRPTRKNMEKAFEWLMGGIQPGDSLVFYFSGHGLRQRGVHGDEFDGFDESICPVDFEENGVILDNYINQKLVQPLIEGVTLHAIIDSCHSGTVLDLPYVYNRSTGKWNTNHISTDHIKGTSGGKVICISACEDYQLAADTSSFAPNREMSGAMTWTFVKAVKNSYNNKTYHEILNEMHLSLKEDDRGGCVGAGLRKVFRRKILQDPLLSSSEEFDTSTKFAP